MDYYGGDPGRRIDDDAPVDDKRTIYFDNNSTTLGIPPVTGAVARHAMDANPSNTHHRMGRESAKVVEDARRAFADRLCVSPGEVLFTSGGTESNNAVVRQLAQLGRSWGVSRWHVVVGATEHKCMLNSCQNLAEQGFEVTTLKPDRLGVYSPRALREVLRPDTLFVSLMHVNNESGVRQDVRALADATHKHGKGAVFVCDCAQSMGKLRVRPRELGIDVLTCSMHKFHGPHGVGLIFMNAALIGRLHPFAVGGPQEHGMRAGTENVADIAGSAVALQQTFHPSDPERRDRNARLRRITDTVLEGLEEGGARPYVIGSEERRMPHVLLLGFDYPDLCNAKLIAYLDRHNVACSIGSACNTASKNASHVLKAMDVPRDVQKSTLRLSVSDYNTVAEAKRVAQILNDAVRAQI